MDNFDHLSSLPTDLTLLIISFLPFKVAVATSILSRHFRFFWHSCPNIDLHYNYFLRNIHHDEVSINNVNLHFLGFIQKWFENYKEPKIQRFSLVFPKPELDIPLMNRIITLAVDRTDIKAIHLDFSYPSLDEVPFEPSLTVIPTSTPPNIINLPFFNSHETVEDLKLNACTFETQQFTKFSLLKNIFLGWMKINEGLFKDFILMCPSLEKLRMKRCWGLETLHIDSPSMRELIIEKCYNPGVIFVDAPLLRIWKFCGLANFMGMKHDTGLSLEEVVLDFGHETSLGDFDEAQNYCDLFGEFSTVQSLTVCSYMLQTISGPEYVLNPKLENIRHLVLKIQLHKNEYYGITFFLYSCPNLVTLYLELGPKYIFEEYETPAVYEAHPFYSDWSVYAPTCVGSSLKQLRVTGYKGGADQDIVLQYLLRFGLKLEEFSVSLCDEEFECNNLPSASTSIFCNNLRNMMGNSRIGSSNLNVTLPY